MKIDTEAKQNVENQEMTINLEPGDQEVLTMANVNIPFYDFLSQQAGSNEMSGANLNNWSALSIDYNYNSMSMSLEDAKFFVNLTQEGQFSLTSNTSGDFQSLIQIETLQNTVSQKPVEVTNQLNSLIEKAQKTQQPVRISFDNDVSVVLKVDKQGKLTAEFIPASIEVENYLKNNIASLRQKFDEQNLPYNDLFYRQNNRQNKNNKNQNKGE